MGQTYPAGASFPDAPPGLACETCYCISGSVHCSDVGCWCFLGAADAVETLTFGQNGGLVGYRDSATLATNSYTYSRTPDGATTPSASCMPALPPCLTGQMLDINDIRNGDWITLQMPYATFHYRVQYHQVVPNTDWKIIRPQGYERLVLSACHPLYSAAKRIVVFAKLVRTKPRNDRLA